MSSSGVAASGTQDTEPARDAQPSARGARGVFAMPVAWAKDALDDLVDRGVVDAGAAEELDWGRDVTRYTAAIAFDQALHSLGMSETSNDATGGSCEDVPRSHLAYEAVRRCVSAGIIDSEAALFVGEAPLTRLEFARWLDRLLGLAALPIAVESLEPLLQDGDPVWIRQQLFDDIPSPSDSALVNRLQAWLILRLPRYGRCPQKFEPNHAVSWNGFVVCLQRAISFIDRSPVDVSTPRGSIRAMKRAFWRCDFAEMDRYIEDDAIRPGAAIHEVEAHAIRFVLCDAPEFMDSRVTKIDHMADQEVRVSLEVIAPFDGAIQTQAVDMRKRGDRWVVQRP